jgi:hypothetical protein
VCASWLLVGRLQPRLTEQQLLKQPKQTNTNTTPQISTNRHKAKHLSQSLTPAVGQLLPCLRQTLLALTKKHLTTCSRQALVLQRLTLSSRRTPETNCYSLKRLSPRNTARFPMSESRRIMGVPRRPKVSMERGANRHVPHSSCQYCTHFSVSLWAAAAPEVAAEA